MEFNPHQTSAKKDQKQLASSLKHQALMNQQLEKVRKGSLISPLINSSRISVESSIEKTTASSTLMLADLSKPPPPSFWNPVKLLLSHKVRPTSSLSGPKEQSAHETSHESQTDPDNVVAAAGHELLTLLLCHPNPKLRQVPRNINLPLHRPNPILLSSSKLGPIPRTKDHKALVSKSLINKLCYLIRHLPH
ncbi:uncharacterized protein VP01_148g10 [Puccinia sorghi]|uniref:Uncharacterized protein n=1 Tax=Puccinia sorghi TaxID=27349 RepID=A0A0L6VJE8_9BASI|nr:uncharacterized protein VP01_148g10 [Puccinia sorghi]